MKLSKGMVAGLLAVMVLVVGAAFAFKEVGKKAKSEELVEVEAPKSEFEDVPQGVMDAIHQYSKACGEEASDEMACRLAFSSMNDAISQAEESQPGSSQKIEEYKAMVEREMEKATQPQAVGQREEQPAADVGSRVVGYPSEAYPPGTECEYKSRIARTITQFVLESPDTNYSARMDEVRIKLQQDELAGNLTRQEAQTSLYILKRSWGRTPVEAAQNAYNFCQQGKL